MIGKRKARLRDEPDLSVLAGKFRYTGRKVFSVRDLKSGVLNTDDQYQRSAQKSWIKYLAGVLAAGGVFLDPIWVCQRKDGTYWILDGLQRYLASQEACVPLLAIIHDVDDIDTERAIFHILQMRRKVSQNHVALTWPNGGGTLMRLAAQASAMEGAITGGGARDKQGTIAAGVFAKGLVAALSGSHKASGIQGVMARLDYYATKDAARARRYTEAFCQAVADAFAMGPPVPKGVIVGLGEVLHGAWDTPTGPIPLTKRQIKDVQSPGGKDKTWKILIERVGATSKMMERVIVPAIRDRLGY